MSVLDKIKEVGVSSEVGYLFPKECSQCKMDLELSTTLMSLRCPNPFCRSLYVRRALNFCEILELPQFGSSFFEQLVEDSAWSSEFISDFYKLELLAVRLEKPSLQTRFDEFKQAVSNAKSDLTTETYLRSLSIPLLDDIIEHIVKQYQSLSNFYQQLDLALDFDSYLDLFGLSEGSEDLVLRYLEVLSVYRQDILGFTVS